MRTALLMYACLVPAALGDPLFRIVVDREGDTIATGVATAVASDMLLSSHGLLTLGDSWVVVNPSTGARHLGTIARRSRSLDLVLIRVPGLSGSPIPFAADLAEPGRSVDALFADGNRSRGLLSAYPEDGGLEHTAVYPRAELGAPVVNNCDELIGINQLPTRHLLSRMPRDPALPLRATALPEIEAFLREGGVAALRSATPCLSLEEQIAALESESRQTSEQRTELEGLRQQLESRNESLERARQEIARALEAAGAELAAERAERERLEALAEERDRELAEQQAERERELAELQEAERERERSHEEQLRTERETRVQREEELEREQRTRVVQKRLLVGAIIAFLALSLVSFILLRRRKAALRRQRERAAAMELQLGKANARFSDILLVGRDAEGSEFRLKINGPALARKQGNGQILGRHPASADHVLNHPEVSRQHLRLFVESDQLKIVDLESFNGTAVNGTALVPNEPGVLADGDMLRVGSIVFRVTLLG